MKKTLKQIISFTLVLAVSMCMVVPGSTAFAEDEAAPQGEVHPYYWYRVTANTALFSKAGHESDSKTVCYIGAGSLVRITEASGLWSKVVIGYSTTSSSTVGWQGWIETAYLTFDHYGTLFE